MDNKKNKKKKIKIGIFMDNITEAQISAFKEPFSLFDKDTKKKTIDVNPKSLLLDIWTAIEMELKVKNKYEINREIIKSNSYDEALEVMNKGNFDILIGAFEPTLKRRKKTNFSETYLICTPTIIYKSETGKTKLFSYFKYLVKLWVKPLILLLMIGFLLSMILYKFVNIRLMHSLYYSTAALFGARGAILRASDKNNPIKLFFGIFILFIIYFFTIYINASTTAKSVQYFKKSMKIENTIEGLRILTFKGWLYREIVENGGLPIEVPEGNHDIMQYYVNNREKLKLDGFLTLPLDREVSKAEKLGLNISELVLNRYHASFPISYKNKELADIVNQKIRHLKDTKELLNMCSLWTHQKYVMC